MGKSKTNKWGVILFYDKIFIHQKLHKWEGFLREYNLPSWDELPSIGLYMDQVIVLLTQYLSFLPQNETDDKIITSSIINNYVRMKIIPPPEKKKYSRVHLAYLLMICTLKQSLNIAYVQKMIPLNIDEQAVQRIYSNFVTIYKDISLYFIDQIKTAASTILDDSVEDENAVSVLVLETAVAANLAKLLTEKIVKLQKTEELGKTENKK